MRVLSAKAQEKQYAAQMARRKETIATIRARDEAPLARPKGYDPNHAGGEKVGRGQVPESWRIAACMFACTFGPAVERTRLRESTVPQPTFTWVKEHSRNESEITRLCCVVSSLPYFRVQWSNGFSRDLLRGEILTLSIGSYHNGS